MPDLEKQIADWRRATAKETNYQEPVLDELESHLREEFTRLIESGTNESDAFQIAVSRLGPPAALGDEFEKVTQLTTRTWLPVRLATCFFWLAAVSICVFLLLKVRDQRLGLLLISHIGAIALGYVTTFAFGGLAMAYAGVRLFQDLATPQKAALRGAILRLAGAAALLNAAGVVLGMLWARQHLGRYWGWDAKETGGFLVVICCAAVVSCRWSRGSSARAFMALCIVASLATSWAWFGIRLFGEASQEYGLIGMRMPLAAFWALHLILLVALLVPANGLSPGRGVRPHN